MLLKNIKYLPTYPFIFVLLFVLDVHTLISVYNFYNYLSFLPYFNNVLSNS